MVHIGYLFIHFLCSDSSMVDSCRNEASLYRHILLSLIGSSGVDWNEDEDLHSLVLSLGQP